jgi:hypothetical protein
MIVVGIECPGAVNHCASLAVKGNGCSCCPRTTKLRPTVIACPYDHPVARIDRIGSTLQGSPGLGRCARMAIIAGCSNVKRCRDACLGKCPKVPQGEDAKPEDPVPDITETSPFIFGKVDVQSLLCTVRMGCG